MSAWALWFDEYDDLYRTSLFRTDVREQLVQFHDLAASIRESGNQMMFAGNGASASISSHGAVDFTKQGRVRSRDFNEANLITCLSNDYGYENWMAKAVEFYGKQGDALILTSVSGTSKNALAAAQFARRNDIKVVSFTGSNPDNPLRMLSDIEFWVDSKAYNIVECTHMIWMTTVVDMLVGKAEYSVT